MAWNQTSKRPLSDDNIQCLFTIPSLVAALSSIPDSVEMIFVGGEALTGAAIDAVKKSSAKLVSAYGPTEASNMVCARTVLDSTNITSLGTFFPNVQTYVACPDSLALKEFGEWGELLIGGDQVGLGYLNRPELTAEKFISNPWGAGTLYRTGDLVRFGADGQLEIGGRIDFQVGAGVDFELLNNSTNFRMSKPATSTDQVQWSENGSGRNRERANVH